MILYRIIPKSNLDICNNKIKGLNSFIYNQNMEYIHFFILPENAHVYWMEYQFKKIDTIILKCDIPLNLIEFGVGLYIWYYHFKYVPFLEARINKDDFQEYFIKEKASYVKYEWKNQEIFKRYLINCIYNQKAFTYVDKKNYIIKLNENFNFLHYFNKFDLQKEHIFLNNYPKEESLINLKQKELSFIKRLLINIKENIENLSEYDTNFIDLKYYEKKLIK